IPAGFALPLSTQGKRWTGFYRSVEKGRGNRYIAKCKYCLSEFSGKTDRLHQHVLRCSDWLSTEKSAYLQKVSEESSATRKRTHNNEDDPIEQSSSDIAQQPSTPSQCQSTLNWYTRPLPQAQSEKLHQNFLKAKKLNTLPSLINLTISLDRWTDNSGNSIYGFMVLKERQKFILDILDL
ncbi:16565_t:CDS:2, partial [Cetraspora pellucida]